MASNRASARISHARAYCWRNASYGPGSLLAFPSAGSASCVDSQRISVRQCGNPSPTQACRILRPSAIRVHTRSATSGLNRVGLLILPPPPGTRWKAADSRKSWRHRGSWPSAGRTRPLPCRLRAVVDTCPLVGPVLQRAPRQALRDTDRWCWASGGRSCRHYAAAAISCNGGNGSWSCTGRSAPWSNWAGSSSSAHAGRWKRMSSSRACRSGTAALPPPIGNSA